VRYVYDGNLVIEERNANNLPQVAYTRGRDLSGSLQGAGGISGLLARTDLSPLNPQLSTAFYHSDGNGNITCLINASQAVVAKYLYDPYGNVLSASGLLAGVNLYQFSSKEFHANSGLIYYLYRFYDSNLQRWVNRDPLGDESVLRGRLGSGSGLPKWYARYESLQNPYSFARNSSMSFVDSDGRVVIVILAGGGVLIEVGQGVTIGLAACMVIPSCRNALYDALGRALNKIRDICHSVPQRTPEEEAARKKCIQDCHDTFDDAWELSICIRRCNGGWFGPNPPRPIWPN
jgi:RHS repeat-associated protein